MSSLIYLIAMVAVGWLVLWTIRDPKQPRWDWWPIEWWPFDTQTEADAEKAAAQQAVEAPGRGPALPWRERRAANRSSRAAGNRRRAKTR